MHVIRPFVSNFSIGPVSLTAGSEYLVEDVNAGEFLAACTTKMEVRPWLTRFPAHGSSIADGFVVVIPGGYGDLIFLGPVIQAAREKFPDAPIAVSCFGPAAGVVSHWGVKDVEILPYPLALLDAERFAHVICLEMLVQRNPGRNPVDLFADALGLSIPVEKRECRWVATREELNRAASVSIDRSKFGKRIGMQIAASAMCRTWPADLQMEFITLVVNKGWQVVLFGGYGDCNLASCEDVINLTQVEGMSFADSVAIMHTCDGFVAPDSALCHVAGAIHLPTVAIYGPFQWQERTMYAPTVFGINGHAACAPCRHHVRAMLHNEFPAHGPCATSRQCEALRTVSPKRVLAQLEKQMLLCAHNQQPALVRLENKL